jgi:hypothetical protein
LHFDLGLPSAAAVRDGAGVRFAQEIPGIIVHTCREVLSELCRE